MSTLLYGRRTLARKTDRDSDATDATGHAPGATPQAEHFAEALPAMIPAEIMSLHALILSATTDMVDVDSRLAAGTITVITEPDALRFAFWGLCVFSVALYAVPHLMHARNLWQPLDFLRALVPPLAFTAWCMLQRTTAFDAVASDMGEGARTVGGLMLAAVLFPAAAWLASRAEPETEPELEPEFTRHADSDADDMFREYDDSEAPDLREPDADRSDQC